MKWIEEMDIEDLIVLAVIAVLACFVLVMWAGEVIV